MRNQKYFKTENFDTPAHRILISIDTKSLMIMRKVAEKRETSVSALIRDLCHEEHKHAGLKVTGTKIMQTKNRPSCR